MSTSVLLWSTLALSIFWAVGAYNRLTRMRGRCLESFAVVGQHLLKYSRVTSDHAMRLENTSQGNSQKPMGSGPELWAQLQSELVVLGLLLGDTKSARLDARFSAINEAGNAITSSWGRMRSTPLDLAGAALPDALVREWDENSMNVKVAVDQFNENVAAYNAALCQFPANMIGGFFDLKPARQFSIFNEA